MTYEGPATIYQRPKIDTASINGYLNEVDEAINSGLAIDYSKIKAILTDIMSHQYWSAQLTRIMKVVMAATQ